MPAQLQTVLMIVVFIGMMYFLMVRPQQKRLKEHESTINALQSGTRVLLTSGVYATVSHLGDQQAVVELAPGVEVTIRKSNIARVVGADEEEFDFGDDEPVNALVDPLNVDADADALDDVVADEADRVLIGEPADAPEFDAAHGATETRNN